MNKKKAIIGTAAALAAAGLITATAPRAISGFEDLRIIGSDEICLREIKIFIDGNQICISHDEYIKFKKKTGNKNLLERVQRDMPQYLLK